MRFDLNTNIDINDASDSDRISFAHCCWPFLFNFWWHNIQMFPWNIFRITNEFYPMKLNFFAEIIFKTSMSVVPITYSRSRYSNKSVMALYASWMHMVSGFHFELRKTTTVTPSISLFGITSIIPASKIYRIVSTEKFSNISGQVFCSLKKFVTRECAFSGSISYRL